MSLVTMFTDASWNYNAKIGVYAIWAKCDGDTIRHSGQFNTPMPQIGTAELGAISYGLLHIARGFDLTEDTKVLIQTDSLEAISAYRTGKHPRQIDRNIALHIKEFAKTHGWRLELRHVKGHLGNATPRNAVNNWCDKECSRQMGKALASITGDNVVAFPLVQSELEFQEKSVG